MPKIVFKKMPLLDNIDLIKWAFFDSGEDLDIHSYTIELFPELKNISLSASQEEVHNLIEKVVKKKYRECESFIEKECERYNNIWASYNNKFFEALQQYLNISWPSNKRLIVASVGVIPVFPRYLDSFSFAICSNIAKSKIIETCAHESLHFLWFEKWKQIYKNCKQEEFESPHIIWKYSEMVVDPILNSKSFKDIFNLDFKSYDSFYLLMDENDKVMKNLINIYNRNGTTKQKIIKGFEYIKSYFKLK